MGRVFNDKGYESEIILENGTWFLKTEDLTQIEDILHVHDIGFICVEFRSEPQAALFRGLSVCINESLTSLIIGGIIMPATYDSIRYVFKKIRKKIKEGSIFILSSKEASKPDLILTLKT